MTEMVFVSDLSPVEQATVTRAVMQGIALRTIARHTGMSTAQIRTIVHRVCLHANPDLYCETVKANVKRSPWGGSIQGYVPSLCWLRQHRAAFGFAEPGEGECPP